ncbi:MAG: hypothetical protein AAGA68_24545 [Pseudomonadota bacterium]
MIDDWTPHYKQGLFLWELIFAQQGEALNKDLETRKVIESAQRKELADLGLITCEPHGSTFALAVTDQGWEWATANLSTILEYEKSRYAGYPLQSILMALGSYLENRGFNLAELLVSDRHAKAIAAGSSAANALVSAYLSITNGQRAVRVKLAELRRACPSIERRAFDAGLRELEASSQMVLYTMDDPLRLTETDRAAAIGTEPHARHLVYLR